MPPTADAEPLHSSPDHQVVPIVRAWSWRKSRKQIYNDSIGYLIENRECLIELLICFVLVVLGHFLPSWIFGKPYQNPILYQETQQGDVMLELLLDNDLQDESVPNSLLSVLCIALPLLILSTLAAFCGPPGDAPSILCVYLSAVGLNWFWTNSIKLYCGYWRPNFYQLCAMQDPTQDTCQSTEALKSFPSGHSSLALCSMTVVTLYWLGKIGVYRCKYPSVLTKLHALVALLLPISLALWIAASRVRNHFHHPADVVTGGLLGYICAQAATRLWYPSIGDRDQAGIPIVPHVTMETDREESTAGGYVYGSHHDGS